ncbi:MAG: hypothetical protein ACSHYB_09145 [Roseibacillus sp.]
MSEFTRIAFLSSSDHSNRATLISRALNEAEDRVFESKSICLRKNKFDYEVAHDWNIELDASARNAAIEWLRKCDWIVFSEVKGVRWPGVLKGMSSFEKELAPDLTFKETQAYREGHLVLFHRGSCYRENSRKINKVSEKDSRLQYAFYAADLHRLSLGREKDICLWPSYSRSDFNLEDAIGSLPNKFLNEETPLQILHLPSNAKKGSGVVKRSLEWLAQSSELSGKLKIVLPEKRMTNAELLALKRESHICIDQFSPEIGGFGMTAIESLAAGSLVLASIQNIGVDAINSANRYIYEGGMPILDLGTSETSCREAIDRVVRMSRQELSSRAEEGVRWLAAVGSAEALSRKLAAELGVKA